MHRDWGDRGNRRHARLKYVIAERGEEWARERLSEDLGKALAPCRPMAKFQVPDHLGWHEQGDGKFWLGVPVAASDGAVAIAGEPAWLPAPVPIALPSPAPGRSDLAAQSQLLNELPAFFQAYANGDSAALNRFLAPGVRMTGLAGTVAFDSIAGLHVPPGGTTRQITVSVIWQLVSQGAPTGAKLQVTYSMSVVQQSGVKWYVKEISASIEAVGAQ